MPRSGRRPRKRPGFVLFVAVKPCRLPTLSDHIRRCELFGIPEDAARIRFREFMQKREAPATAAFPGKVFAVSNIPIRVPEHFLGRDDALAAIETALGALRGPRRHHGAARAARRRQDDAGGGLCRAPSRRLPRDLVDQGADGGRHARRSGRRSACGSAGSAPTTRRSRRSPRSMERLRHEGEGILLIFDNAIDADALKPYLPRGGAARVLVTSNAPCLARGRRAGRDPAVAEGDRRRLPDRPHRPRGGARRGRGSVGGARRPAARPRAGGRLLRAARNLARRVSASASTPRRRELLDAARDAPAEYHDRLTVAKTFALAIDEAAKLHPAAEPLIVHAALLAPEPIPLFLFAEAREKFGEPLASALAGDGLDEAVAALRAFALVDRETIVDERDPAITTDTIRLHRLVREVAAARREGEAREAARRALDRGAGGGLSAATSSTIRALGRGRGGSTRSRSRWSAAMRRCRRASTKPAS